MDRRQLAFTLTAVALALVLGAGVALLATSGGDDETADPPDRRSTTTTSAVSTTTTTTLVLRPGVTVPTTPPPTIQINPPSTTTPTTKAPKPKRKRAPKATTTTTAPPVTVAPQAAPATDPPTTQPPTTQPPTTQPPTTASSTTTTTTTIPVPVGETGISPTQIRLAVIADDEATLDGASAWASALNRRGGLAGRKLRLDLLGTGGTPEGYDAAVASACERSFAIVATRSVHDANAEPLSCGVPDVAVETTTTAHTDNSTTYAAFPRQSGVAAVGPYRWLQDELDDCCAQFVLVPAEDGPGRAATEVAIDAGEAAGFDTVATPDVPFDAPSTDYDAYAQDIGASGATFATSGLGADSTLELRRAATAAGVTDVAAWYCDARCYDLAFAEDADSNGEYVAIETVPFSDRRDVPELRAYLRATARAQLPSSYEGLRAYVAGVLFEETVAPVLAEHGDDGLTRERLLASLASIDAFTGRGLVGSTDVGGRTPNGCFVLLQADAARFTRVSPAERGSLDCGSQHLVVLDD